jgi:hypothetical protein
MVTMGGAALPLVSGTTAEAAPWIPPDDPGVVGQQLAQVRRTLHRGLRVV